MPPGSGHPDRPEAMVVRDEQAWIPLSRILTTGDILVLLTPVVVPHSSAKSSDHDPFEPLGRRLAKYHRGIKHVPYTARNGITSTHVALIKAAKVVVFAISGPPQHGQPSQVEISEVARAVGDPRPQIIVACCGLQELGTIETPFPTIVQLSGYAPGDLEVAADLLFGGSGSVASPGGSSQLQPSFVRAPKQWRVEGWTQYQDLPAVHELWWDCMPDQFRLDRLPLQMLLDRYGYAKHFVVRDPGTKDVLGFCATYTTFFGSEDDERLIGCLACIIVRPSARRAGIGTALHDHALRELRKTRGVTRLKLGSTFPRLLYGLPVDLESEDWFRRRGWRMDQQVPGSGQEVCDWLLRFGDWPATNAPLGLNFRPCALAEMEQVKHIVKHESIRNGRIGWYDQYARLGNTFHARDIILGLEGNTIVAIALTYIKHCGSTVEEDLPWAGTIADDVGGVTCICITDDNPSTVHSRDFIMAGLIDACVGVLKEQNQSKLLVDAVSGGAEGFRSFGFKEWARYRDVWCEV